MATVYRYDFYDRALMHDRRSDDYATADAIQQLGGVVLPETAREIDDALVDAWGMVKNSDLAQSRAAAATPPTETLRNPAEPTREADASPGDVVRDEIDIDNPDQVRDWTQALGVTTRALEDAVRAVGTRIHDVRKYLGNIQS